MSENILPINPERRDPGILRKKVDVGLGNVDNLSTGDFVRLVLDEVKDSINQYQVFPVELGSANPECIGLAQFTTSTAHSVITVALIDLDGEVIEGMKIETVYTEKDLITTGTIEVRTLVSMDPVYLKDAQIKYYEKKGEGETGSVCNLILELPGGLGEKIGSIGINIFQYTPGTVYLDTSNINNPEMYFGYTLLQTIPCDESYFGVKHAKSALGLAVYDKDGELVDVENGQSLVTSSGNYLDFPTINEVPFIGYLKTTINGASGRNITVTAKHKSAKLSDAGEHAWEVLREYPQSGLVQGSNGFISTVYYSHNSDYGLCRISQYSFLNGNVEDIGDMIKKLLVWGSSLSSTTDDVVPVGAFREFLSYLGKILGALAESAQTDQKYVFTYQDSGDSYTSSSALGTTLQYKIVSKLEITSASGSTSTTYPSVSIQDIDQGDSDEIWLSGTISGSGSSQKITIGVLENKEDVSRKGSILIEQAESGSTLRYTIYQSAGSSVVGFRVFSNKELYSEGDSVTISKGSEEFTDEFPIYPVTIDNGIEYEASWNTSNFKVTKTSGDWLILDTQDSGDVLTVSLSASENPSSSSTRTAVLKAEYNGKSITINVLQGVSSPYITIDGNSGTAQYTVSVTKSSQTKNLVILTNNSWVATESVEWLTVSPTSGASGSSVFGIDLEENTNSESRNGTIKISSGGISRSIYITQEAADYFLKVGGSSSELIISHSSLGESEMVEIYSNMAWTINNIPSWITLSKTSGGSSSSSTETVIITSSENKDKFSRIGSMTVTGSDGTTRTINVSQSASSAISISTNPSSLVYEKDAYESRTITVTSNDIYSISTNSDWIKLSSTSGGSASSGTYTSSSFTISLSGSNTAATDRSGTVTLIADSDEFVVASISVTQYGEPTLSVSNSILSFGATGSGTNIIVTTNVDSWSYSTTDSWLILSKSDNKLVVIASENKTENIRTGSIVITASTVSRTINVIQAAGTISTQTETISVRVVPSSSTITSSGGIITLQAYAEQDIWTLINGNKDSKTTVSNKNVTSDTIFALTKDCDYASISSNTLAILQNTEDTERSIEVKATYDNISSTTNAVIIQDAPGKTSWYEYSGLTIGGYNSVVDAEGSVESLTVTATRTAYTLQGTTVTKGSSDTVDLTGLVSYVITSRPATVSSGWSIEENGDSIEFSENTDGTKTLMLSFKASYSYTSYSTGMAASKTVESSLATITQKAANGVITVSPESYTFPNSGTQTKTIVVSSNAAWKVTSYDTTKYSLSAISGTGNSSITVTNLETNTTTSNTSENLVGFSTIQVGSGSMANSVGSATLTLNMAGISKYARFSSSSGGSDSLSALAVASKVSGVSVYVVSNTSWTIVDSEGLGTKFNFSSTSGSGNATLQLTPVESNWWPYEVTLGSVILRYTTDSGTTDYSVSIIQEAEEIILSSQADVIVGSSKGSTGSFSVLSNTDWSIVSAPGSKFTVFPESGTASISSKKVVITASAESTSTNREKIGYLVITSSLDSTKTATVNVYQDYTSPSIVMSDGDIWVGPVNGETKTITFTTNYSWTISLSGSYTDAIQISSTEKSGSAGTNSVVITTNGDYSSNSDRELCNLNITCTSSSGEMTLLSKTVMQRRAYPYVTLSPSPVYLGAANGSVATVTVNTNADIDSYTVSRLPYFTTTKSGTAAFILESHSENTSTTMSRILGTFDVSVVDPLKDNTVGAPFKSDSVSTSIDVFQSAKVSYVNPDTSALTLACETDFDLIVCETNADSLSCSVSYDSDSSETEWLSASVSGTTVTVSAIARKWKNSEKTEHALGASGIRSLSDMTRYGKPRKGYVTINALDTSGVIVASTSPIPITQSGYESVIVKESSNSYLEYGLGSVDSEVSGSNIISTFDINPTGAASEVNYSTWIYAYKMSYTESTDTVSYSKITSGISKSSSVTPTSEQSNIESSLSAYQTINSSKNNQNFLISLEPSTTAKSGYVVLTYDNGSISYMRFEFTQPAASINIERISCDYDLSDIPSAGTTVSLYVSSNISIEDVGLSCESDIGSSQFVIPLEQQEQSDGTYLWEVEIGPNTLADPNAGKFMFASRDGNMITSLAFEQNYSYIEINNESRPCNEDDEATWETLDIGVSARVTTYDLDLDWLSNSATESYLGIALNKNMSEFLTEGDDYTYTGRGDLSKCYSFDILDSEGNIIGPNSSGLVVFDADNASNYKLRITYNEQISADAYSLYTAIYKLYLTRIDVDNANYFYPIKITHSSSN